MITKLTDNDRKKIIVGKDWKQLESLGLQGPYITSERTEDVPSLIYNWDKWTDKWVVFALESEIIEWDNMEKEVLTEAPTTKPRRSRKSSN